MYVCLCKGVTDHTIASAVAAGAESLRDVSRKLGIARQCGKCACVARGVIDDALAVRARANTVREAANDAQPAMDKTLLYYPAS